MIVSISSRKENRGKNIYNNNNNNNRTVFFGKVAFTSHYYQYNTNEKPSELYNKTWMRIAGSWKTVYFLWNTFFSRRAFLLPRHNHHVNSFNDTFSGLIKKSKLHVRYFLFYFPFFVERVVLSMSVSFFSQYVYLVNETLPHITSHSKAKRKSWIESG